VNLNQFISEKAGGFPGKLLFARVCGSYSYNTMLPTSDRDFLAVFVAPTRDVLSIHPPSYTVDGVKPDFQAHEVGKFCSLLLKGNPGIIECLFTKIVVDDVFTSASGVPFAVAPWGELTAARKQFLSQRVVKQYLGYAMGQMQKLKKGTSLHTKGGKLSEKWSYHIIRLLNDAVKISSGEEPVIWKEGQERELLMAIRNGRISTHEIVNLANSRIRQIEDMLSKGLLPKEGDEKFLNKWLLSIRYSFSSPTYSGWDGRMADGAVVKIRRDQHECQIRGCRPADL
jgi:hypothetical protein